MKPVTIDRQSVLDAACMLIGSAIGASASVAVFFYVWIRQQHHGLPPVDGAQTEHRSFGECGAPGEPQ